MDAKKETISNDKLYKNKNSVLIVEDDKFLRDLLLQKLNKEGLQTFAAIDGEMALFVMKKNSPRIVLLDLLLPGMSGFEVLEKMKENPDISSIPVIVLSNLGEKKDIEKALELGAKSFLIKVQHTIEEIIGKIRKVLIENYV